MSGRYGDGGIRGRRIVEEVEVSKRVRDFDPEASRQRRKGMAIAATAIGGGALTHSGAKGVKRATQIVRAGKTLGNKDQLRVVDSVRSRGVHVLPEHGARLAGGLGLLGVAGRAQRNANDRRYR